MTSGPTHEPPHEIQCPECRERFPFGSAVRINLASGRILICPRCATRLELDAASGVVSVLGPAPAR